MLVGSETLIYTRIFGDWSSKDEGSHTRLDGDSTVVTAGVEQFVIKLPRVPVNDKKVRHSNLLNFMKAVLGCCYFSYFVP